MSAYNKVGLALALLMALFAGILIGWTVAHYDGTPDFQKRAAEAY